MALRLDERIPETGFRKGDDPLDAFLAWAADQGLALYPHQEEAILEIFSGNHVVLDTPTGSGKSLVATALHFKTFAGLGRAWYTAPIKALVSEKFFELCRAFGPEHVGMMTGDGAVNRDAPIVCCTAEILANLALREGPDARVTSVVMDEFHYYGDRDRGIAWQIPLLTLPGTQFLLLSATLGDTTAIRDDLANRTGRPVVEVRGVTRPVPLHYAYAMTPEHETLRDLVRGGKAPVYVVHFTQNAATEQAQALTSTDWCTKEEKRALSDAIRGFGFHSPFGQTVRRYVQHGIGLHHAGLLPRYRLLVERLAQQGLLKVICGTDTLGVGINVPIRTVLFTQLCKFDGEKVILLPVRDFKQIAGRAGRAGYDTQGHVVAQAPAHVIENATIKAGEKKKKVKAQAPTKGYKHWDEGTFQTLVERPPEALESRFSVDHGRLLLLMQHAEQATGDARPGFEAMLTLIEASHASPAKKAELRQATDALTGHLEMAGLLLRGEARWTLSPGLQHDFSLHHSLSLFLISALAALTPGSPTHALDTLTLVESILEQPRVVLQKQVDRAKTTLMAEMKAAGVPFEERIAALEDVTWPKPNGTAIYEFFADYQRTHPWLVGDAIRPKSVAREMVETYASFSEYVNTLGLHRSEGVLLRYLSEAYKALVQNVPAEDHTDDLLDLIAFLRAMLAQVDSSLVTEWEALLAGPGPESTPRPVDVSAEPRAFRARVRAELHAVVKALAGRDWESAAAGLQGDQLAEAIPGAIAPFLETYGEVGFDPRARAAANTVITKVGPHQWDVRQALFPPARAQVETWSIEGQEEEEPDEGSWEIRGTIDLRDDTNPPGPLVRWVHLGDVLA